MLLQWLVTDVVAGDTATRSGGKSARHRSGFEHRGLLLLGGGCGVTDDAAAGRVPAARLRRADGQRPRARPPGPHGASPRGAAALRVFIATRSSRSKAGVTGAATCCGYWWRCWRTWRRRARAGRCGRASQFVGIVEARNVFTLDAEASSATSASAAASVAAAARGKEEQATAAPADAATGGGSGGAPVAATAGVAPAVAGRRAAGGGMRRETISLRVAGGWRAMIRRLVLVLVLVLVLLLLPTTTATTRRATYGRPRGALHGHGARLPQAAAAVQEEAAPETEDPEFALGSNGDGDGNGNGHGDVRRGWRSALPARRPPPPPPPSPP